MTGSAVTRQPFGELPDGRTVHAYTLGDDHGTRVVVLDHGALLQTFEVPDRLGRLANVTLGFADLSDYLARSPYFGATVGRYANRIGYARCELDGRTIELPANLGEHHIHGGHEGFDRKLWTARPSAERNSVTFTLTSPDGDEGYPGTLDVAVTYTLTGPGTLRVDYSATTDQPTVVNLTNHTYFNLAGEGSGSVSDHVVEIAASRFTAVDAALIPTGEIAPVDRTPLDFRTPTRFGLRLDHPMLDASGGYDHNFVLDRNGSGLHRAAQVTDPTSGRVLTVDTTEPGVQLYGANGFDGSLVGPSGRAYNAGDALCLETQHFPDSPNHPHFPSTVLRPGTPFTSTTTYAITTSAT
jgi:aldose 1-epimerase